METQRVKDLLEIATKIATIVAITVGAGWAWFQFIVARTDVPNIELTTSVEVSKYDDNSDLLVVHIHPKNRGRSLVVLDRETFTVEVREMPEPLKPGSVDMTTAKVAYREDLMKRFRAGYQIEPGVEYDEVAMFRVQTKKIYFVVSTLTLPDRSEVDHTVRRQLEIPVATIRFAG